MANTNRWQEENIPDQSGRMAIVTGANSGIGYEAARMLVHRGATVVLACRDEGRGKAALRQLLSQEPAGSAMMMPLDLADLASVQGFVKIFRSGQTRLDLLINNAGVMMIPERQTTAQGFEMQFGTNHLGHFALTGLLIDLIVQTRDARVVTVSSEMHRFGGINFEDLQALASYAPTAAYAQSKLANLLFTIELGRRLHGAEADTIVSACHPGWTATNLQRYSRFAQILNPFIAQKPAIGALPTLYAATAMDVNSGDYIGPDGLFGMRGYPRRAKTLDTAQHRDIAAKLWAISESLTGVHFPL